MDFHYNAVPIKSQMPEAETKLKTQSPNAKQSSKSK